MRTTVLLLLLASVSAVRIGVMADPPKADAKADAAKAANST